MEAWLERLEESGWKLRQVKFLQMYFVFEQDQNENKTKKKVSYSIDFHPGIKDQYSVICEDDGWVLKSTFFGWYIWRKESECEVVKLYTDYESIIERNRRIYMFLIFILLSQVLPIRLFLRHSMSRALIGPYLVLLFILGYSVIRLVYSNYRLKKEKINEYK